MKTLAELIPPHHKTVPFFVALVDGETEVLVTAVLKRTACVQHYDRDGTRNVVRLDRLTPTEPDRILFVPNAASMSAERGNRLGRQARWDKAKVA